MKKQLLMVLLVLSTIAAIGQVKVDSIQIFHPNGAILETVKKVDSLRPALDRQNACHAVDSFKVRYFFRKPDTIKIQRG